jgi:hypothetical protein
MKALLFAILILLNMINLCFFVNEWRRAKQNGVIKSDQEVLIDSSIEKTNNFTPSEVPRMIAS